MLHLFFSMHWALVSFPPFRVPFPTDIPVDSEVDEVHPPWRIRDFAWGPTGAILFVWLQGREVYGLLCSGVSKPWANLTIKKEEHDFWEWIRTQILWLIIVPIGGVGTGPRTDAFASLHDFLLNHHDISAEYLQANGCVHSASGVRSAQQMLHVVAQTLMQFKRFPMVLFKNTSHWLGIWHSLLRSCASELQKHGRPEVTGRQGNFRPFFTVYNKLLEDGDYVTKRQVGKETTCLGSTHGVLSRIYVVYCWVHHPWYHGLYGYVLHHVTVPL